MKTTIRIQNFKSLEDITLELAPTTVFLGPNGAGKSSVLKMMKFVAMNLAEPLTSKPRKTKYKFSEELDLGSYREIVTNNDQTRNITLEMKFSGLESTESFFLNYGQLNNWELTFSEVTESIRAEYLNVIKKTFKSNQDVAHFFFNKTKKIDFSLRVTFSSNSEGQSLSYIEVYDNQTNDRLFLNYSKILTPGAIKNFGIITQNEDVLNILRKVISNFRWEALLEQHNWVNAIQYSRKLSKFISRSKTIPEDKKHDLFNECLFTIIKFYCIYSVIISRHISILLIPSIRTSSSYFNSKFSSGIKENSYLKYFIDLPSESIFKDWLKKDSINYPINKTDSPEQNFYYNALLSKLNNFGIAKGIYKKLDNKLEKITVVTNSGAEINYNEASSGLIQLFPIIAYSANSLKDYKYIAFIEQPELHLHPGLQSLIPAILHHGNSNYDAGGFNRCIIETHSEHIIRAFQILIAKGDRDTGKPISENFKFYYFQQNEAGITQTTDLKIDDIGNFVTPWPNGFFNEASNLSFELLEAQVQRLKN